MSNRNVSKIYGNKNPLLEVTSSDEESEPIATSSSVKNAFSVLYISSDSDVEQEGIEEITTNKQKTQSLKKKDKKTEMAENPPTIINQVSTDTNTEPTQQTVPKMKRKTLNKAHKTKQKKQIKRQNALESDDLNGTLKEIAASTSTQEPSTVASSGNTNIQKTAETIFAVKTKHLNASEEFRNIFGSEDSNRRKYTNIVRPRDAIVSHELRARDFSQGSISMSLHRIDENGCHFFMYDHCKKYQAVRSAYLNNKVQFLRWGVGMADIDLNYLQTEKDTQHVEVLLQALDIVFGWEKYAQAEFLLERVIALLQHFAHPMFKLTSNVRLEYTVLENRPFHIAILKYLHILTNKGCHRTSLELAKLLLKLDPSDPLAVIFIIDSIALRAREHEWLIDAIEYFYKERNADLMFNLQYSLALAQFHVISKSKGDLSNANDLLQKGLFRYPWVAIQLLKFANVPLPSKMRSCPLYTTIAAEKTSPKMKELITFYAKYIWSRWKEQNVLAWFIDNINDTVDMYEDSDKQEEIRKMQNENLNIFKYWPREIERHLCVIYPMAKLIMDGEVPPVYCLYSADPIPPANTINRYSYLMGFGDLSPYDVSSLIRYRYHPNPNPNIDEEENARGGAV